MPTTASLIYTNVPENDYPEFVHHTATNAAERLTYAMNARVISTIDSDHAVYMSLVGSNTSPLSDLTKWQRISSTNRWKLHDKSIQSKTVNPNRILKQYRVSGLFNCLAILEATGSTVTVRQFDEAETQIYAKSVVLNDASYSADILNRVVTDIILTDLIKVQNSYVEIDILNTGANVSIGEVIFGESIELGPTQYGAKIGITDFSTKEQDQFGNYDIAKRAYRKIGDFQVMLPNNKIDFIQSLFAYYRASPLLFVGSDQYASTSIYGFFRDFDITISYPQHSLCSINVEGLT